MKATFDIPDKIMEEAATYSKASQNQIIVQALEEYNRRRRAEKVINMFGTMESLMTNDEIEALEMEKGHY